MTTQCEFYDVCGGGRVEGGHQTKFDSLATSSMMDYFCVRTKTLGRNGATYTHMSRSNFHHCFKKLHNITGHNLINRILCDTVFFLASQDRNNRSRKPSRFQIYPCRVVLNADMMKSPSVMSE